MNILVPIDFSKNSTNALNYALELARVGNAKIILLHVVSGKFLLSKNLAMAENEARMHLQRLQQEIIESKKIFCEPLLKHGNSHAKIIEAIAEQRPDLAVMGTQRNGAAANIGHTTMKVLEKANCPILVVPQEAIYRDIANITYATDYNDSDFTTLKLLTEMMEPFNSRIKLLHISDKPVNTELEKFKEMAVAKTGYKNFTFEPMQGKNIEKDLERFSEKKQTDLLVMSTHHRGLIDKVFGSSITRKVALHTKTPLLVFHHKQKPLIFIFGLAIAE